MHTEKSKMSDHAVLEIGKGIKDNISLRGKVVIQTINEDGEVIQETINKVNQITLIGDAFVADQLSDQGEAAMGWMSVGTTSGGKSEASTTLEAENTKNALDSTTQGAAADDNDVIYVGTFTGIAATLLEAGIFNVVTADTGVMLCYTEFSHVMTAPDTLVITWTLSIGH